MGFTKDQQKAIDTLDKSILVSAAAGSGKTTVLIERIINIILSGEADVDEMLVVTFTNAAASDMKLKLIKALKNEIAKTSDDATRRLLSRQLNMIYRAYISTFHAFASRVIKEFFHETEVGADFKIADDMQSAILKMEALDETLEACFADDGYISGGSFKNFARKYIGTSDEEDLKVMLFDAYDAIRSMPDYFKWAESALERLNVSGDYSGSFVCEQLAAVIKRRLIESRIDAEYLRNELMAVNCPGLAGIADGEATMIQALIDRLEQNGLSDEWIDSLATIEWLRFAAKSGDDKDAYTEIKKDLTKIRDGYKSNIKGIPNEFANPSLAASFEEMSEIYDDAKYFIELLKEFERCFDAKKRERQLVDFNDIEHIAVSLLENSAIAEIMRNRFKFIFVDEYQDTNYLQEYLISMIARPNNIFKVGDIKQSIYRFRQAEPQIFAKTAMEYESQEFPDAERIDLNENFRSNGRTINFINAVFEAIMDGYDDRAALHLGSRPDLTPRTLENDLIPEVHVLVDRGLDDGTDAAIQEWSKKEAEAEHIADIVEGIIGMEFYDGKRGCVRRAKKGDIAILYRGNKPASTMYNVLKNRGIPTHVSNAVGYFDALEIRVVMSLLRVVDNIKKDVPLIATLHSEIFGFTPEELGEIRAYYIRQYEKTGRYDEYSNAVKYYAEEGPQGDLRNKLAAALTKISDWHERSLAMPLDDFIWYLLTDSDYYLYAGAMYAGAQRQANLRALVDHAKAYRDGDVSSLGDFIKYLDRLQKKQITFEQAVTVSENDDIVRVMTVHKSKGLEFPFVIIGGMGSKMMGTNMERRFFCDHDIGFSLPLVDVDRKFWRPTLMQRLIHDKEERDDYAEEKRVLYVAMTRAREKLYLVGTVAENHDLAIEYSSSLNRAKKGSYFNMILPCLHTMHNKFYIYDLDRRGFNKNLSTVEEFLKSRARLNDAEGRTEYAEIARRLGYAYPYRDEVSAKRKLSVSEIRKEVLSLMEREAAEEEATFVPSTFSAREPEFLGTHKYTRAEVGTAYHRIMEFIDFRKAISGDAVDSDYIRERLDKLLVQEAIPAALMDEIDLSKIEPFFESDIGRRACEAAVQGKLYKEKPFTLKWNYQGRDIYVQGVIDCCFEEAGKMVLVDYKSSYIKAGDETAEAKIAADYAEQINIYRQAVEEGTGRPVSEAYLYLFMTASALKM